MKQRTIQEAQLALKSFKARRERGSAARQERIQHRWKRVPTISVLESTTRANDRSAACLPTLARVISCNYNIYIYMFHIYGWSGIHQPHKKTTTITTNAKRLIPVLSPVHQPTGLRWSMDGNGSPGWMTYTLPPRCMEVDRLERPDVFTKGVRMDPEVFDLWCSPFPLQSSGFTSKVHVTSGPQEFSGSPR